MIMKHDRAGLPVIGPGMTRAASFLPLPAILKELGVAPAPLLKGAGLASDALSAATSIIPIENALRLLIACADRTGIPHFGLLVGQRVSLEHYGLIGLRMQHATSVGTAWRGLVLTLHLNGRFNVPALTVRDGVATLSFTNFHGAAEGTDQGMDLTLATACVFMRTLCGARWRPVEVHLAHHAPADPGPYTSFFKAPVRFGAIRTALLFPAQLLDRPIAGANKSMRMAIERIIAEPIRASNLDLLERTRRIIFALFTEDGAAIAAAARMLGMHKRTLNRRLAERNTSFAALVSEAKYQIARELLVGTDLPVVDIAAALHYTEAGAFSRAFRQWSGSTPSGWRQKEMRHRKIKGRDPARSA
jgi:AraC-like DNA-binding protein